MKKTLTAVALLAGAASVYSQQVAIADYSGSFLIQIMNVQSTAPANGTAYTTTYGGFTSGTEYYGNTVNANGNGGTTVYSTTSGLGTGYDVQLLAAPGTGDALSTLSTAGPITTTWYTATPGGNPATGTVSFYKVGTGSASIATIPNVTGNGGVTVALAAWNNEGGTVNSLAAAEAGGTPWGISAQTASIAQTGGGSVQPPNIPNSIADFSIGATVPEPSTIALGVIGASALLFRRRK
jgi:hypothetical protein